MKRKIYFDEFHGQFCRLIGNWKRDNDTDQRGLAKKVAISETEISDLLTGRRKLSNNYLSKFFAGNIFSVKDICGGVILDSDQTAFLDAWEIYQQIINDHDFMETVMEIKKQGHDPKLALRNFLAVLQAK